MISKSNKLEIGIAFNIILEIKLWIFEYKVDPFSSETNIFATVIYTTVSLKTYPRYQ